MRRAIPLLPQLLTFGTMIAGMASIILTVEGHLIWAGTMVLIGVLTDMLDGKVARATKTGSDFGLQLDSLADTVCFGVASSVLIYQYLRTQELSSLLSLLVVMPVPIAGIFRLARFNLLPAKTGREDEIIGLPITTAGGTLALAGLSGLRYGDEVFPLSLIIIVLLPLFLSILMASRVRFPTFDSILRRRKTTVVVLGVGTLLSIQFSFQLVSLTVMLSYVGFGVLRAGYGVTNR